MADPDLWPPRPAVTLKTIRTAIELCELFAELIDAEDEEDIKAAREALDEMERTGGGS